MICFILKLYLEVWYKALLLYSRMNLECASHGIDKFCCVMLLLVQSFENSDLFENLCLELQHTSSMQIRTINNTFVGIPLSSR